MVLKGNYFVQNEQNCPCFWPFWLRCYTLWSSGHLRVQTLQQLYRFWPLWANMAVFVTFVPRGKNLSNCLVLGISWLRPTSNNTKHTPWDPLVYKSCKSWVSKVLCLIPDSVLSWGLSRKRTWCHARESLSIAVPILPDTDQLWTLLWFTCGRSSSFCHRSSVYVGGRAGSLVCPLSAADLVYLSGEGLGHRSVLFLLLI